jgi:hypothetical protein
VYQIAIAMYENSVEPNADWRQEYFCLEVIRIIISLDQKSISYKTSRNEFFLVIVSTETYGVSETDPRKVDS